MHNEMNKMTHYKTVRANKNKSRTYYDLVIKMSMKISTHPDAVIAPGSGHATPSALPQKSFLEFRNLKTNLGIFCFSHRGY